MTKLNVKHKEEYTYYLFMHLKNNDKVKFRSEFLQLHPTDQTDIFKQMNQERRAKVYHYLSGSEFAEIFKNLHVQEQKTVYSELEEEFALFMLTALPADDMTDFLGEIPDHIATYLLAQLDKEASNSIKLLLSYKEETAGSLMTTEYVTISPTDTVSSVLKKLRTATKKAETIYYLYVVNENRKLVGVLSLRELISSDVDTTVHSIMKDQMISVYPDTDQQEVSKLIKDYDLLAVPVITNDGTIIGIVTVDDIIDVIEEETTDDIGEMMASKGALDLDTDSLTTTKKRLPWLIILLFLGLATAGLITTFEATLTEIAVLAMFIPLIADMGGNTGTQSLAVVVRGLALHPFNRKLVVRLLKREAQTGLLMGFVCGIIVSFLAMVLPFGSAVFGIIIGLSLFATVFFSTLTGTIIPLIVHRFKIDPAIASGPFITTINDIVGLFVYFTIATTLLHYL
ncbi:magnesium transporter [Alkalihalobacterium bogoriense]|uniref:magnesium transporter n=1 Tax=Alkalihalobacterium bogoriense TaxID=246272 RepID=UPI00047E128A|nr:magnesium transporter [Alkalihalobacterium bogoriense]